MPSCQLAHANRGVSRGISTPSDGTQGQETGVSLRVAPAQQWVDTTTGRLATDPYSWMQTVHWVGGSGLYTPSRTYGPKWGPTTVLIAQEISALLECRPGVDYLARKLKLSRRTVQYHLDMLREAGLLVYRSKGTRLTGSLRVASVYERVIPTAFDEALGIRTLLRDENAPAYKRVPVGIGEQGRKLIGKLAKKAARKVRRRGRKNGSSGRGRCTPMQVGTSASSSAGTSMVPPESKLAGGNQDCPTPKKPKCGPRNLNRTGRRHQLARELVAAVPWLNGAAADRVAWAVRDVADAGWSVHEVQAHLGLADPPDRSVVRRPSALLAYRLKGVHLLIKTKAQRHNLVVAWQDRMLSRREERPGADWDLFGEGPSSGAVKRLFTEAARLSREFLAGDQPGAVEVAAGQSTVLEDLPRDLVIDMRRDAELDPAIIHSALDSGMPEADARRLYTNRLVDQALTAFTTDTRIDTYA
ncbi:winged helix-turn-helix domain-containing protein [Streptomyces sp. NPDC090052]|uniref:helix-turn-helix domain-containing protein n=1 Tax=Streptomyces sp. NPDC090052 TaxID=3365931 RepID=UPI00380F039A